MLLVFAPFPIISFQLTATAHTEFICTDQVAQQHLNEWDEYINAASKS